MTTKKRFDAFNPPVIVLKNGRYAYRVQCPWLGKNDKVLHAFKFCSAEAYNMYMETNPDEKVLTCGEDASDEPRDKTEASI
jgi:hypothetical protein